jgi:hypothetical protein
MDSFSTTSFFSITEEINTPTPQEGGSGNNGGSYCVIAKQETVQPVDMEGGSGNNGGSYCIIA